MEFGLHKPCVCSLGSDYWFEWTKQRKQRKIASAGLSCPAQSHDLMLWWPGEKQLGRKLTYAIVREQSIGKEWFHLLSTSVACQTWAHYEAMNIHVYNAFESGLPCTIWQAKYAMCQWHLRVQRAPAQFIYGFKPMTTWLNTSVCCFSLVPSR
jgi:hypothetical protein